MKEFDPMTACSSKEARLPHIEESFDFHLPRRAGSAPCTNSNPARPKCSTSPVPAAPIPAELGVTGVAQPHLTDIQLGLPSFSLRGCGQAEAVPKTCCETSDFN